MLLIIAFNLCINWLCTYFPDCKFIFKVQELDSFRVNWRNQQDNSGQHYAGNSILRASMVLLIMLVYLVGLQLIFRYILLSFARFWNDRENSCLVVHMEKWSNCYVLWYALMLLWHTSLYLIVYWKFVLMIWIYSHY